MNVYFSTQQIASGFYYFSAENTIFNDIFGKEANRLNEPVRNFKFIPI